MSKQTSYRTSKIDRKYKSHSKLHTKPALGEFFYTPRLHQLTNPKFLAFTPLNKSFFSSIHTRTFMVHTNTFFSSFFSLQVAGGKWYQKLFKARMLKPQRNGFHEITFFLPSPFSFRPLSFALDFFVVVLLSLFSSIILFPSFSHVEYFCTSA